MHNFECGSEPFDLKLFILKCLKKLWVIVLCTVICSLVFGGIYYYKNVVRMGEISYEKTNKFYLTYAVDPSDQQTYSYFAGYTWTDFLKSDASIERIMESLEREGFTEDGKPENVQGLKEKFTENNMAAKSQSEEVVEDSTEEHAEDSKTELAEDSKTELAEDSKLEATEDSKAEHTEGNSEFEAYVLNSYEAGLESDLRILYITVTGKNQDYIEALSRALEQEMYQFPLNHKEILETKLMTTGKISMVKPDIRTFRAFVLGAVLGGFFAVFAVGFSVITGDVIDVPQTLQVRYGIPVLGYLNTKGKPCMGVLEKSQLYLKGCEKVALTPVDMGMELMEAANVVEKALKSTDTADGVDVAEGAKGPGSEEVADGVKGPGNKGVNQNGRGEVIQSNVYLIPSIFENAEGLTALTQMDGVVVTVNAGQHNGKAIAHLLTELSITGVNVKALLLLQGDEKLINTYYFGKMKKA